MEDETGAFDWVNPQQVHAFVTELLRPIGTYLYGRRLYETMACWDAPVEGYPPEHRDFARVWQKAECHLFINPVIVGGGKPAFRTALRRNLELLETRRFKSGVIHLRYRIRGGTP